MKELFETKTEYTYKEYKKFNKAVTMIINNMIIKIVTIDVCFLLLAYLYMTRNIFITLTLLLCAMFVPLIFVLAMNDSVKRTYESNKVMKDIKVSFKFYSDFVSWHHKLGDNKIEYKDLYRIIETKDNIYLMIAKNQGLILKKENCSKELQEFLNKKK